MDDATLRAAGPTRAFLPGALVLAPFVLALVSGLLGGCASGEGTRLVALPRGEAVRHVHEALSDLGIASFDATDPVGRPIPGAVAASTDHFQNVASGAPVKRGRVPQESAHGHAPNVRAGLIEVTPADGDAVRIDARFFGPRRAEILEVFWARLDQRVRECEGKSSRQLWEP